MIGIELTEKIQDLIKEETEEWSPEHKHIISADSLFYAWLGELKNIARMDYERAEEDIEHYIEIVKNEMNKPDNNRLVNFFEKREKNMIVVPEGEILISMDFTVNSEGVVDFSLIEDVYIYMSLCRFCGLKPQVEIMLKVEDSMIGSTLVLKSSVNITSSPPTLNISRISVKVIGPKSNIDELEKRWKHRDDIYVAASIFKKLGYNIVEDLISESGKEGETFHRVIFTKTVSGIRFRTI